MSHRGTWLAAIAATLGISEAACRRDGAPQAHEVASASASSSAPLVGSVAPAAPSASAELAPSASAIATASASAAPSASVARISPTNNPFANVDPLQGICGATAESLTNTMNQSCGVSSYRPGTIASGGIGSLNTIGHSNACGAPGNVPGSSTTSTSPRAEVTLSVSGGAAGDDHVATNLRPRFRACANQALRQDPSQQGKLVIMVKIAANGEVSDASVRSNTGLGPASAQCMVRMVKNAQFAAGAARTLDIALVQTKQSP